MQVEAATESETKTEPMETDQAEHSEEYKNLIKANINDKVCAALEQLFKDGIMKYEELDERATDALKDFNPDGAIQTLKLFRETNLDHVTNKSAYLCGMLKSWRTRNAAVGSAGKKFAPDEAKLKEILDRTGYTLDVTTGQRKYGGPPPNWDGPPPSGCEVFMGKIPKEVFEDELIPLFEKCGKIWDLRLMMDPSTGLNRGYGFVTFCEKASAQEAVKQMDNHEVKKGKRIKCNLSTPNLRLFVGNIPKSKDKDEILAEFSKLTVGLQEVIVYAATDEKKKNRGFCFLEYDTHKSASIAKRRLSSGRTRVWNCDIIVDWADPQDEPDAETMSKVKVLYVRNLKAEVTEEKLKEAFSEFGNIERVKKLKDYGFLHFENRDDCVKAMEEMNGQELEGAVMEVCLAKPPTDKKKKEQRQERRFMAMMGPRGGAFDDYYYGGPPPPRLPMGGPPRRGGRMPPPPPPPAYYDDYYDYSAGYGDPYYEDFSYSGGYDDFDSFGGPASYPPYGVPPPRIRGPMRGAPDRARARGMPPRGARGGLPSLMPRGGRGWPGRPGRGARGGNRGRGRGAPRGNASGAGGKRKFDGSQGQQEQKKRLTKNQSWGTAPIAQQPLGNGAGAWYEDSYGGGW